MVVYPCKSCTVWFSQREVPLAGTQCLCCWGFSAFMVFWDYFCKYLLHLSAFPLAGFLRGKLNKVVKWASSWELQAGSGRHEKRKCLKGLPVARITIVRIVCQILLLLKNFMWCPYNSIKIYEEEFIFCLIAELNAVNCFQDHGEFINLPDLVIHNWGS